MTHWHLSHKFVAYYLENKETNKELRILQIYIILSLGL